MKDVVILVHFVRALIALMDRLRQGLITAAQAYLVDVLGWEPRQSQLSMMLEIGRGLTSIRKKD